MYISFCKEHNKKKSQEADRSMFSFGEEKGGDGVTSFSALAKHADLQNSWPRKEQSKVNYIAPAGSRTRDARVGNEFEGIYTLRTCTFSKTKTAFITTHQTHAEFEITIWNTGLEYTILI